MESGREQRVVGEVDAGHDVGDAEAPPASVSAKKLSGLRFSTMRPTGTTGTEFFGHDLRRVEDVEGEASRLVPP
jgi:hypothetical protein